MNLAIWLPEGGSGVETGDSPRSGRSSNPVPPPPEVMGVAGGGRDGQAWREGGDVMWGMGRGPRCRPSGKPHPAHLPPLLLLLLHLQLQFPHHNLPLPLGDGPALLVVRGDERLHVQLHAWRRGGGRRWRHAAVEQRLGPRGRRGGAPGQ